VITCDGKSKHANPSHLFYFVQPVALIDYAINLDYFKEVTIMKKLLVLFVAALMLFTCTFAFVGCGENTLIVYTNAFFAPFEYYQGRKIVGVDVDVMKLVGEKLDKKVKFVNVDFQAIVPAVSEGVLCDAGAAGITITTSRQEQVDFSTPYYKSVQYVIYKATNNQVATTTATNGKTVVLWESLAGMKIGVQTDTTGHLYVGDEIDGGVLAQTNAECTPFSDAQLAVDAIGANQMDVVVVDELPAQWICNKNTQYVCAPLYYDADTATEEEYAICVTKGNQALLDAINEVLAELGKDGIDQLVKKHMGLED